MTDQAVISVESHPGAIVAVVQIESLDDESNQQMQEQVTAAAEQDRALALVLDLSRVTFMPSMSLGALVTLLQECKQHSQRFVLAGVHGTVRETLAMTHLDKIFEICDDVDKALSQVQ